MTKSRDLGNVAQTVAVNLPTSLGTAGQSLVVNSAADGLEFGAASGGSGVTVYTGLSGTDGTPSGATYLLNVSSPSAGDLAYVTANTSLYQYNGYGWYRIAVINTTPTISSVADASSNTTPFTLEGGTNTVITVTASDADEGTDLTYSHSVTSGSLNGTTVTQGTGASENVFTIAPHSSNATTFSITFSVSDSINAATSVAEFTLKFIVDDSHYTTLLMATDGSAGDNNDDIADATGNHTSNITVSDNPSSGTFSPYRQGGYSVEFVDEGSNGYGLQLPAATFNNPSTTFTIEAWVYLKSYSNNATGHYNRAIMGKGATYLNFGVTSDYTVQLYHYDGTARYPKSTGTVPLNEWTHVCAKVDSGSITFYINGSSSGTGTWYGLHSGHVNTDFYVGMTADTNGNADKWWDGYLSNVRFVDGTAITPASGGNEALDPTTTNTEFLLCASNRFIDSKSTSPLTVTLYRTPKIVPIGPYDYEEYSASTNGGSIEFDGSNDGLTITDSTDFDLSTGSWTIEFWWNPKSVNTNEGPMSVGYGSGNVPAGQKFAWENNRLYLFVGQGNGSVLTSLYLDATADQLTNKWNHIAAVYDGTNTDLYLNGTSSGRAQNSNYGAYNGSADLRVGSVNRLSAIHYSECSISDVRIVKGTAVYSGAFTPPTGPLTTTGGTYPSTTNVDTSITSGHTKLLLKGTDAHVLDKSQVSNLKLAGTAASTSALTSGSTPPYIGAAWANTSAVSFDGDSDYVFVPASSLLDISSSDITIEGYFYTTSTSDKQGVWEFYSNDSNYARLFFEGGNGNVLRLTLYSSGTERLNATGTTTLSIDTWYHIAVTRDHSSGAWKTFIDGVQDTGASGTESAAVDTSSWNFEIGRDLVSVDRYWNGYIQDFRFTQGKNRYPNNNFTVPSSSLKG